MNGTPDQIIRQVTHYYEELGIDKYIMAPANSVQPGTPPQNIVAAYQAASDFG